MKTRFLSLLYFFVAAFVAPDSAFAGKDSAPSDFHAPQTDAEKALDKLLLSDKNNGGILRRPEGDVLPSKEDNEDRLYTQKLLISVMEKGKRLKNNTGGENEKYYSFLGNFLTCGTRDSGVYKQLFHTIKEDDRNAVIVSVRHARVDAGKPIKEPLYKLIKDGGDWKLDGIVCKNDNFNMSR